MQLYRRDFTAMAGPCALQVYATETAGAETALQAALAEVRRIEAKYSRYRPDSLLSRINASAGQAEGIVVDAETAGLLDYAATAHAQSGGLFDISSGVLRRAWDFRAARLPAADELEALLPLVGWSRLHWQRPRLVLPVQGMELDFGGFGKEYAADRAAAVLLAAGFQRGLVDLAGDLRILGPHPDGSPWRVGIRHPRGGPEQAIAVVELASGAIASSGDYERYFEQDGRRYSHILDPRSGWPVEGSSASVSVVADRCLLAGTATTIALLKGAQGPAWLAELGLPWLAIGADGRAQGSLAHNTG
ncbi:FAD:protein FMN transferase [Stagnimonas aquatica]|uniref:FAD:protein FMN transferase n=1 Tax=Stagnimonas aquatica TaxID=2689987 RepID=A0A3N0UYL9_9GAMM|nr:FAD:protein FMN transferase [Stagnimonas aquatica]ROH85649.1 FAD:protein FMN transferase [Stagnimonas aquatica]